MTKNITNLEDHFWFVVVDKKPLLYEVGFKLSVKIDKYLP